MLNLRNVSAFALTFLFGAFLTLTTTGSLAQGLGGCTWYINEYLEPGYCFCVDYLPGQLCPEDPTLGLCKFNTGVILSNGACYVSYHMDGCCGVDTTCVPCDQDG
ncbi:hypothetical protein QM565_02540 [Geitlerinema splendidum]|nr:hypothetical protein [Geitlerinema splendidum]